MGHGPGGLQRRRRGLDYLPHDHARSQAYRWGEDGLAGFCDVEQRLCLGLALWNGRDPILKERPFGLTGAEANHGEDVKEYWWYLDALPSHAWNRWRYHYPQRAFPYEDLRQENSRRSKCDPEYELLDTGVFDEDRYWVVEVHYAKADPHDLLMSVQVTNAGPEPDTLHVLPTAWFRNTWSWDYDAPKPELAATGPAAVGIHHPFLGELELIGGAGPGRDGADAAVLRERDQRRPALRRDVQPAYPKDGINDHVVGGRADGQPRAPGHQVRLLVPGRRSEPGATVELRLRLRPEGASPAASKRSGSSFDEVDRQPASRGRRVLRRADAEGGLGRRGDGDAPGVRRDAVEQAALLLRREPLAGGRPHPATAAARPGGTGATRRWQNFDAFDIMSMPDKWEYPWFAAWDLAFHCVALAHVDPAFAKYQLILLCREWFQHPNGALPAYEWDFGDVNPPVQAWAALEVFAIDGGRDIDFLSRVFDKLLVNFTWWVNLEDEDGQQPLRGRLPRAGQHRADRPLPPAGRRHAGAVRRHRLDGFLRPRRWPPWPPCLNRSGQRPAVDLVAQVRRALRRHPRGHGHARACGTTPTASSTTGWSPRTGPRCR